MRLSLWFIKLTTCYPTKFLKLHDKLSVSVSRVWLRQWVLLHLWFEQSFRCCNSRSRVGNSLPACLVVFFILVCRIQYTDFKVTFSDARSIFKKPIQWSSIEFSSCPFGFGLHMKNRHQVMETAIILTGTRFISSTVLSCGLVSMITSEDIGKETRNIITARSSQNNYTACLKKIRLSCLRYSPPRRFWWCR